MTIHTIIDDTLMALARKGLARRVLRVLPSSPSQNPLAYKALRDVAYAAEPDPKFPIRAFAKGTEVTPNWMESEDTRATIESAPDDEYLFALAKREDEALIRVLEKSSGSMQDIFVYAEIGPNPFKTWVEAFSRQYHTPVRKFICARADADAWTEGLEGYTRYTDSMNLEIGIHGDLNGTAFMTEAPGMPEVVPRGTVYALVKPSDLGALFTLPTVVTPDAVRTAFALTVTNMRGAVQLRLT